MPTVWDRVIARANLVSLPDIYWRLKELLDSHNYSMPDIASLISHDPGLTARLLRIVNSAYFGFASKIDSIDHATAILGVQQLHDLILTTSIASAVGDYQTGGMDVKQFWQRSLYRAIAAKNLAAECNVLDGDRLFVAGLLAGLGHLIMYQSIPELSIQAKQQAEESGQPLHLVEQQLIGFDHAAVAAALMEKWQLPASLVYVTRDHLEPDPEGDYFLETAIVHIAASISNTFDPPISIDDVLEQVDDKTWDISGLKTEQCVTVNALVKEQLNSVISILFPKILSATG